MMAQIPTKKLGKTDLAVPRLGFGGAPLGNASNATAAISDEQARRTIEAAWSGGIRYFDTAPFYGYGLSEQRLGQVLRQHARREFTLSTKVGRVLHAAPDLDPGKPRFFAGGLPFEEVFDYSYDGIMRSYEDSLQRLGLARIDLLVVHDLDFWFHKTEPRVNAYLGQLATSGWRALEQLRSGGQIKGVGAGINEMGMMPRFVDYVDLDFFLVAMPYNLLDQHALDRELPLVQEHGLGVVIGAVFASGILATGPVAGATYNYKPAPPEIQDRTRRIASVCQRHSVTIQAAAIQFPLFHPVVDAVIPGAIELGQVTSNIEAFSQPIPAALWRELKAEGLLRQDAPVGD